MKRFRQSLSYALNGLVHLFRSQRNARIHAVLAGFAIALGIGLKLSNYEWILIILIIGLVLCAEAFNTAIESLCDKFHPELDSKIKLVKDLSAAAVLIISLTALASGLIIFVPKIIQWFSLTYIT